MVMSMDPALQALYEEQARRDRERLLAEQEAAARAAQQAQQTTATSQPSTSTTQQQAQLEALQWGQGGSAAPAIPTTGPIYTNPTPTSR